MASLARNLNNFFVAASNILELNSDENLANVTSTLHIISVEQDLRSASPGDVTKFFEVLSQVFDKVPTKTFLYSTLKSVISNKQFLQELCKSHRLCQQLFKQIPTQSECLEMGGRANHEIRGLQKLLEVLEMVSSGFTAFWNLISLQETLYRLSKLFMMEELPQDVKHLVLVILLNVCSANHASISVASAQKMRVETVVEKLIMLSSEQAFNASTHNLVNAFSEPQFNTPLVVTHLLLKLEKVCGQLDEVMMLDRVTWTFLLLVEGITNKDVNITTHASNFLSDFVSMPEKAEFLMRYFAVDSKIEDVIEALCGVGSITPTCNRAVLMLLTNLLELVPSDRNPESLAPKHVAIIKLCNEFMLQMMPSLRDTDNEQACTNVELAESCMSLCLAMLSKLKQLQVCYNNLPVLQDCVRQSATLLLNFFDGLQDPGSISCEAHHCITVAFQLLCHACKSSNLTETVTETLSEDGLSAILSSICSMNVNRLTSPMVVWGVSLATSSNHWAQLRNQLFLSQEVCYHIAYTIKCCRCKDALCAFFILERLPEPSMKTVSSVLEYFPIASPDVVSSDRHGTTAHARPEDTAIYHLKDNSILMEVVSKVNENLQKWSGTESCDLDMLAIVEAYQLQHQDSQAQVCQLQRCVATAESVVAQQSLSNKQMEGQLEATRERLIQATKRTQAAEILNHSQQKRLKEFETNNRELMQENKKLHSLNLTLTEELGQKLQASEDQCKELQEANTAMEEKLARYKKEMAMFKQKNNTLQEENATMKTTNQNLKKEVGGLKAECDEYKRIQATVQKLMLGNRV